MRIGQFDVRPAIVAEKALSNQEICTHEMDVLFSCLSKNEWNHAKCTGFAARLEVCIEGQARVSQRQSMTMKSITYQMALLSKKLAK
jgi:hypothetical protein